MVSTKERSLLKRCPNFKNSCKITFRTPETVLFIEVSLFQRVLIIEVPLYMVLLQYMYTCTCILSVIGPYSIIVHQPCKVYGTTEDLQYIYTYIYMTLYMYIWSFDLSQPCKVYGTTEDLQYMFTEMVQRSEQLFASTLEAAFVEEVLSHLPTFMQALSSISTELEEVRNNCTTSSSYHHQ